MRNYHFTEIRGILKKNSSGYFVVVSDETVVFFAEYLMENKQFMREFEISYRFLKSLGLDGTYRSYKKH